MPQQHIWRWCGKCEGLAFAGHLNQGACPVGGKHNHIVSFNYVLTHDEPFSAGQANWRWCRKCQGLAYAGNPPHAPTPGKCSEGGQHDHSDSYDYVLFPGTVSAFRLEVNENGSPVQIAGDSTIEITNASKQAAVISAGTVAVYIPPDGVMFVDQIVTDKQIGITVWEDHPDGSATQVGEVLVSIGDAVAGGFGYALTGSGQIELQ